MIEICIWEDKAPKTTKWAEEVRLSGGYTASHVPAIINYLQIAYSYRLRDFAPNLSFFIIGAWVEDCLGKLPLILIEEFGSRSIKMDLNLMYSKRERVEKGWKTESLDASSRADILFSTHPRLLNYQDLITLKNN